MIGGLLALTLLQATAVAIDTMPSAVPCADSCRSAAEAIAAADAARGEPGQAARYRFTIASVGTPGQLIYLNSASDYRAADNVSVALTPRAASRLRALLGNRPINEALVGRAVIVDGRPRRHTMQVLTDERRPTGRGYYQVRIAVDDISRIAIAD